MKNQNAAPVNIVNRPKVTKRLEYSKKEDLPANNFNSSASAFKPGAILLDFSSRLIEGCPQGNPIWTLCTLKSV